MKKTMTEITTDKENTETVIEIKDESESTNNDKPPGDDGSSTTKSAVNCLK